MFEIPHYHGIIRKVIVGFGTLFGQIQVQRSGADGVVAQTIKVPLAYGPKEKWVVRTEQDPTQLNHTYTTLPRMSFEINGYAYDPSRMNNRNHTIKSFDRGQSKSVYSPVPYNIDISLFVLTKGTEDGLTIVEQILPLFAPEYSLNMMAVPELGIRQDVPIVLNSVSKQDDWEGDFQTRRLVIHELSFTAKTFLYGPIKTAGVITHTDTNVDSRILAYGESIFTSEGDPLTGEITLEEWTP